MFINRISEMTPSVEYLEIRNRLCVFEFVGITRLYSKSLFECFAIPRILQHL